MGIPSGFTGNHIAFHGTVPWNHIFDYTGQYMTNVWFSVRSRRTVVERIGFAFFTVFHTFLKDMVFFPELFHFFLALNEV